MPPPPTNLAGSVTDAADLEGLILIARRIEPDEITIAENTSLPPHYFTATSVAGKRDDDETVCLAIECGEAAYIELTRSAWEHLQAAA